MALHRIPVGADEDGRHHPSVQCPCGPQRFVDGGVVLVHQPMPEGAGVDCGHILVDVAGATQHHQIPDDGAPHAPSTECGCGVQLAVGDGGHEVFVHTDQARDADEFDEWAEACRT